jgi:hypothetical protein
MRRNQIGVIFVGAALVLVASKRAAQYNELIENER